MHKRSQCVPRWIRESSTSPSLLVIHILILGDGHIGQPSGTLERPHPTAGKQNGESHGMDNWIGNILVFGQRGCLEHWLHHILS